MKSFVIVLALVFATLFSFDKAEANWPGHSYRGIHQGMVFGWGWYPLWPSYPMTYSPLHGYSYWPYYHYNQRHASYGAISYSKEKDLVGWSWGATYRQDAIANANQYCGDITCRAVVWVQGGCAALARSPDSGILGWAYSSDRHTATNYGIQACRNSGGTRCQTIGWTCSE